MEIMYYAVLIANIFTPISRDFRDDNKLTECNNIILPLTLDCIFWTDITQLWQTHKNAPWLARARYGCVLQFKIRPKCYVWCHRSVSSNILYLIVMWWEFIAQINCIKCIYDDAVTLKYFPHNGDGLSQRESAGHRWIPFTKDHQLYWVWSQIMCTWMFIMLSRWVVLFCMFSVGGTKNYYLLICQFMIHVICRYTCNTNPLN